MEPNLVRPHVQSPQLLNDIMSGLRMRYASLNNIHYEAAWTDSWCDCRCMHTHQTLTDAARCGLPRAAGWYVLAVEHGEPRQLTNAEDKLVNDLRVAIVESHGGRIWVARDMNHGATFQFSLPTVSHSDGESPLLNRLSANKSG